MICFWNSKSRKSNNLKDSGARKPNVMNMIPKSDSATYVYEENMSFNNNVII